MVKKFLKITAGFVIWFTGLTLLLVVLFRFVPVQVTPLMLIRLAEQVSRGENIVLKHRWVPLDQISPNLRLAVVCSEDQNFMKHRGFDLEAIDKAIRESRKENGRARGASTISQQTAKNLFLWPGRSWVRKGLETWFTAWIELLWSKKRILTVYLNSIEMGNGVYGAEAASRHYFHVSASGLTARQAAAIAAVLPNPRMYNASKPGPYINGRISWIQGQMKQYGPLDRK